ncbi:MAG: hypothetical protein KDD55_03125 [Bdellovibrionales bacterium]|nr:hypothetical protein [Bdellovibrionales bacterium]
MFKHTLSAVGFTFYVAVFFAFGIYAIHSIPVEKSQTVLRKTIPGFRAPGRTATIRTLREVNDYPNVDILFLGSSHAYRGFDPRMFQKHHYTSFNLGTTGQTPLNSYYLLKRYINKLNPKLVIYELFPRTLESSDGLESFYDIVTNSYADPTVLQMAFATHSPYAFRYMITSYLERKVKRKLETFKGILQPNETYIPGGYVETTGQGTIESREPKMMHIQSRQLSYLKDIIELLHEHQSKILFVVHPLPQSTLEAFLNYQDISQEINRYLSDLGVNFFDFNLLFPPYPDSNFFDWHHLNIDGVQQFNEQLLTLLLKKHLLPKRRKDQETE